jgi:hypothetical protein
MTQTIEYVVAVNATQAKGAIADVEKRFNGVTESAKGMAAKLGPAAAAISSVSASLGAAGGAAGKFVAAGGQVIAAFGAGGPIGAAIVAGTVAVDALSASWVKATEAQNAALDGMFASVNKQLAATRETRAALDATRAALTSALRIGEAESVTFERSLEDARKAGARRVEDAQARLDKLKATTLDLKKIEKEAADLDMTFQQARMWRADLLEKEIASAERGLKNTQAQAMIAPLALEVERKRTEAAEKRAAAEEKYKAAVQSWLASYEKMYRFRETPEEVVETTTDELSRTMRGRRGVEGGGVGDVLRGQRQAAIDAMTDDDILTGSYTADRHGEWQKSLADVTREINDDLRRDEIAAWEDFYSGFAELGIGMFGTVAGAAQNYFDDVITGQEHAAELAGVAIMRNAGDALVGSGIKLAGESVVSAFTPGMQPLAAVQAGAAAGLIAAGMGLGAGATAVEHTLSGGVVGQKLPDEKSGTRDPGASPRSSGASPSTGGPMIINVTYGAGGPLPEDVAREIHRTMRSGDRRSGR